MNLDTAFADLDRAKEQLTAWETNFATSVKDQYTRRGNLSQKQVDILRRIAKKYTPEAKAQRSAWAKTWSAEKAIDIRVVAAYYKVTDYYQNVVDRILENPEFVPSEKLYNAMCTNKFALRVLAAYHADAKYNVGQMVVVKNANRQVGRDHRALVSKPVLILEVLDTIVSAAKGAKRYLVASVQNPRDKAEIEERDLKLFKRRK